MANSVSRAASNEKLIKLRRQNLEQHPRHWPISKHKSKLIGREFWIRVKSGRTKRGTTGSCSETSSLIIRCLY